MPYDKISSLMGITIPQARGLFTRAQSKARMAGIYFKYGNWIDSTTVGSGSLKVAECLPDTTPTELRGFALLKQMAEEIKNDQKQG